MLKKEGDVVWKENGYAVCCSSSELGNVWGNNNIIIVALLNKLNLEQCFVRSSGQICFNCGNFCETSKINTMQEIKYSDKIILCLFKSDQ